MLFKLTLATDQMKSGQAGDDVLNVHNEKLNGRYLLRNILLSELAALGLRRSNKVLNSSIWWIIYVSIHPTGISTQVITVVFVALAPVV